MKNEACKFCKIWSSMALESCIEDLFTEKYYGETDIILLIFKEFLWLSVDLLLHRLHIYSSLCKFR